MSTQVQDNGQVDLQTFLNTPLRGAPENHQIYRSDLIDPAAFDACEGNCCAHQISKHLSLDYTELWTQFGEIFEQKQYPGAFDYVTPDIVLDWCQKHGHSCYFLKNGQLLYKNVQSKKAVAFTENGNHFYLYTSANFCANMQVRPVKEIPCGILPSVKREKLSLIHI